MEVDKSLDSPQGCSQSWLPSIPIEMNDIPIRRPTDRVCPGRWPTNDGQSAIWLYGRHLPPPLCGLSQSLTGIEIGLVETRRKPGLWTISRPGDGLCRRAQFAPVVECHLKYCNREFYIKINILYFILIGWSVNSSRFPFPLRSRFHMFSPSLSSPMAN